MDLLSRQENYTVIDTLACYDGNGYILRERLTCLNHSAIYVPPILPTPSQISSKYSTGIKNIISSYSLMEMLDLGQ